MKQIITLSLMASLAFFASCGNETAENEETKTETTNMTEEQSLKEILDEKKAGFNEKASDEKKRIYAEGIAAVVASGVEKNALQVGDKAPDFELPNATGGTTKLSDYLKKGPVILTWYRGGWCPYCNITLGRLQKEMPNFKAQGANLLALTPEVPDSSMSTAEKHELTFEVLSDVGNTIARQYGVVYTLTDDVAAAYQKGFNLHKYNGDETNELPLSATYVIAQDGTIKYAFLDAEYRNRAEPSELTEVLKSIK